MAVHQNSADRGHAPQATGSPPGPGGTSWGGGTRLGNVTDSARARAGGPPEKPAEASPWASGAVTCPGSPSHPKGQAPSLPRTPEGAEGALENSCLRERGLGVRAALRGTRGLELHTASTGKVHALGREGSAASPAPGPADPGRRPGTRVEELLSGRSGRRQTAQTPMLGSPRCDGSPS